MSYTYTNEKTSTGTGTGRASKVAKIAKAVKAKNTKAIGSFSTSQVYGGSCLQLESLYHPDSNGVIYADIILDRRVLRKHTCLVSSRVKMKKVEGNVEIGTSAYLQNVVLLKRPLDL